MSPAPCDHSTARMVSTAAVQHTSHVHAVNFPVVISTSLLLN